MLSDKRNNLHYHNIEFAFQLYWVFLILKLIELANECSNILT